MGIFPFLAVKPFLFNICFIDQFAKLFKAKRYMLLKILGYLLSLKLSVGSHGHNYRFFIFSLRYKAKKKNNLIECDDILIIT